MKFAFVTGASGGIGSAIAQSLAANGYAVGVGYRGNAAAADKVVAGLDGVGHRAYRIDVADTSSINDVVTRIDHDFGACDVLVNCAGMTRPVPHDDLDALDDATIDRIFTTNFRGAFATVRAFLLLLRRSSVANIVNVSSVAATTGLGSNVAYCASKAALDSMTRSLARALAPDVRVNSVAPGWVRGDYADKMPPGIVEEQERATPLGRLATPDEVGRAVVALTELLSFTTGTVIAVDGGRPLGVARAANDLISTGG
jgi:3-oxoacyl-[acyl-carrier protein] reductase